MKHLAGGGFESRCDNNLRIAPEAYVRDPFAVLPVEVLLCIFRFLPGHALLALSGASWPVFCVTRPNNFWKWFLKQDMPWLTELWPLLEEKAKQQAPELSYKTLWRWLNEVTTPRYGMDDRFMSLANRRRIWGACETLASRYSRQLHPTYSDEPESGIVENTVSSHMVLASEEHLVEDTWELQQAMFVYSKDEMDNRVATLEAYWDESCRLVGLVAAVGPQRRVFGLDGAGMPHLKRTAERIAAGERVTDIALTITTGNPNGGACAAAAAPERYGVVAMAVSS
jgi:hypothetical protein